MCSLFLSKFQLKDKIIKMSVRLFLFFLTLNKVAANSYICLCLIKVSKLIYPYIHVSIPFVMNSILARLFKSGLFVTRLQLFIMVSNTSSTESFTTASWTDVLRKNVGKISKEHTRWLLQNDFFSHCVIFRFGCHSADGSILHCLHIQLKSCKQWPMQNIYSATKTSLTCWDRVYKCLCDQKRGSISIVKPYFKRKDLHCRNINFDTICCRVLVSKLIDHWSVFKLLLDSFQCFLFPWTNQQQWLDSISISVQFKGNTKQNSKYNLSDCECDDICSLATPACLDYRLFQEAVWQNDFCSLHALFIPFWYCSPCQSGTRAELRTRGHGIPDGHKQYTLIKNLQQHDKHYTNQCSLPRQRRLIKTSKSH